MRLVVFAAITALAVACGSSKVPNDAEVTVAGVLLMPNGTPAAGVRVGLMEQPGVLDALVELTVTVASIGMLCLAQEVSICKGARRTTTGADGRFAFTMSGRDAKTVLGNAARFVLSSQLDSGPQLQIRFEVAEATVNVPETSFWQPDGLKVVPGPRWVEYSWPVLTSNPKPRGYRLQVAEAEDVVWAQDTGPSGKFDARAVSDVQGDLRAIAKVERHPFTIEHYSQKVPLSGLAGAPPSRGAACTIAGGDGPVPVEPCLFTDGRYAGAFPRQSCPSASASPVNKCPANTWVTIDLGTSQRIGTVFLHSLGTSSDITIKTSDDGLKWTNRARHKNAAYAGVGVSPPVTARYVRVQPGNDSDTIRSLHEVTIWP